MKINFKWILIGMLMISMTAGRTIQAADNSVPLLHPDQLKALTEIKGKVQAIDIPSRSITLVDSANQRVNVLTTSNTVVTDPENHAFNWKSLHVGDPVDVFYEPKEHIALQIDLQSTTVQSVLGIEHPESLR